MIWRTPQSLVTQYISGAGTENDLWVSRLGVWMIRRLEQKISASGLLQSSFYIVNIKDNHLLTEKKTNMKVTDIEFIFIAC